jgi:hypothetical protein
LVKLEFGVIVRTEDPEQVVVAATPCPNSTDSPLFSDTLAARVVFKKNPPTPTNRSTKTRSQEPAFLSSRSGAKFRIDNEDS